jgi:hypothetical protein
MAKLRAAGMMMDDVAPALADALRGTLAAIEIDPVTGRRSAANQPGVMVFNSAQ